MGRGILATAALALGTVIANVASDPRKLKPGEVCRILNSTPLGPVIDDRRLRAHRTRAGHRAGDAPTVDLFRYAAWLAEERGLGAQARDNAASADPLERRGNRRQDPAERYDVKRDRERDRQAANSRSGRDIGPCPAVVNPERRAKAMKSFRAFCESYFPERFVLKWSKDHLKVIDRIERSVLKGGRFAMAMPRGSGKTSLCEVAAIWALVTGARKFVMLVGASADAATENLESIKMELEANELLAEDFPEVCFPLQQLEGRANLCAGQHINGERTHIKYGKKELVLPTVEGSLASGGILRVRGITGRIRGAKFTRSDGTNVRPDLVIVDDPQTDASAKSDNQCTTRARIVAGAILGLAGPGKKIAAIMPCTVVRRGDMADQVLDRKLHFEWQGERTKLCYKFPDNEKLWEEYWEIRRQSMINGGDGSEATDFYRKHRKEMDAGAEAAWPERFEPGEISAVQNIMNLRLSNEVAFFAEYQNEPLVDSSAEEELMTVAAIAAKVSGVAWAVVPNAATRLTCYIDVQHRLLYWLVAAWREDFTGSVIDYGAWPDQFRRHFVYRNVTKNLRTQYKAASDRAAIRAGLAGLCQHLLGKAWKSEGKTELRIEKAAIDAADGNLRA